jgi:hypothetical protein
VIAIIGGNDAGIAAFAAGIETPVVEAGPHRAGVDVFVKAAVILGARIHGILGGKLGKIILGAYGLPLGINLVRLIKSGLPGGAVVFVLGLDGMWRTLSR